MSLQTLINGEAREEIPVLDRGFQYGDGLFETIKVAAGKPEFWDRHMARLARGCATLKIPMPDAATLRSEAQILCKDGDGVLKIIVTRGVGGRGYNPPSPAMPNRIIALFPLPDYPKTNASEGVAVRICTTKLSEQPALAGLKHLNRLEQVIARSEWSDSGIAEGLMCDDADNVIEGTMSNVFIVRSGALVTPGLARSGVAGIIREAVIELAKVLGIECAVRAVPLAELDQAEEIFLTNSVIGIWPVKAISARKFVPRAMTTRMQAALSEMRK
jgi:4-amino-4-deoxychorismate lyase